MDLYCAVWSESSLFSSDLKISASGIMNWLTMISITLLGSLKFISSRCFLLLVFSRPGRSFINEPRHDKTNKMSVRPAKTQISLGIRPVWSESSLSAWRKLGSLATHWAHSEDSDQTGRIPRLIWVFAGRTTTLLVLSCRGSNIKTVVHHRAEVTSNSRQI